MKLPMRSANDLKDNMNRNHSNEQGCAGTSSSTPCRVTTLVQLSFSLDTEILLCSLVPFVGPVLPWCSEAAALTLAQVAHRRAAHLAAFGTPIVGVSICM
eukprot:scaffold78518_cov18-Tisochrysis_lutea.AAC.1